MWLEKITVHERTGLSALVTVLIHVFGTALILAIVAAIVILNKNKAVKNKLKGVLGKTRSKIIGFLKDKKIISRRHKKKKGARYTPPKQTIVEKTVRDKEPTVRIVNGRVLPRVPAHPQTQTQTQKNTSSAEKKRENREKDDE